MKDSEPDEVDKLKTKFMSAWHNVKYGWIVRTKTKFSRNSPVFLLGKCYHFKSEGKDESASGCTDAVTNAELISDNVHQFRKDFITRIWLTYRCEFPQLKGCSRTTDCGWGCTLRSGQMLLAQSLLLHFLGRDWVWADVPQMVPLESELYKSNTSECDESGFTFLPPLETSLQDMSEQLDLPSNEKQSLNLVSTTNEDEKMHRTIITWLGDNPEAIFGIHKLIELGENSDKRAGDWYGPALVAHILRRAVEDAVEPELQGITVYVAQDCTVYIADVMEKHSQTVECGIPGSSDKNAVVILIPVRLGGEKVNPEYKEILKGILSLEFCVGIIGGKPKQSFYFVGFQDDSLIYMDPHYCQSFVDVSMKDFPLESYHCLSPKKMSFGKMDPSCTIGLYSSSKYYFEHIIEEVTKVFSSPSKEKYPLFTFSKGHAKDYEVDKHCTLKTESITQDSGTRRRKAERLSNEEFVLL
ncbi:cysteine protease ATG4C isoform X1 [Hypanus sabinus]|uniref:cysteine protease ATG4C isoform X1 n=1 Tax=Hypanus sabinus TaxID=79690 RepID=UPI0028C399A0|nr:cysteine protease ATG4C isoform X1 [Hypanus sabinus]XP_059840404.1 cysteine protease ATG4C isoform X1 [Hypanus sabinus]XP_059840405.1 cysteine protease ATG4C isoform X1 [Hypanus sabinus]